MARHTCLQLRAVGRPHGDVEGRVAALPAAPGVGEVHATPVPGLLRLVRYAAETVLEGPANRSRCPDTHFRRDRAQRPYRSGVALARATTPASWHPLGDPAVDRAGGILFAVPCRAA